MIGIIMDVSKLKLPVFTLSLFISLIYWSLKQTEPAPR